MRPCGICADELGLKEDETRGPFWRTNPAEAFTDAKNIMQRNAEAGIGTSVTRLRPTRVGRKARLSDHYNTESDSDPD